MSGHLNVGRKRLGHAAIVPSRVSQGVVPSRVSQGRQRQCQIKQSTTEVKEQDSRERLQEKYTVDISFSSSFACDLDNDPAFMSALDQIEKTSSLRETSKSTVVQAASKGSDAGLHHVQVYPHTDTRPDAKENRPAVTETPIHRKHHRRPSPEMLLSTSPFDVSIDIPIDMSTPVETTRTSLRANIDSAQNLGKPSDSRKKSSASTANRKRKASYDETPTRTTRASAAKKNSRRPVLDFSGENLSNVSHSAGNKSDFFKSLLLGNNSMETEQYSVCSEIKLQNTDSARRRTSAGCKPAGTGHKPAECINTQASTDAGNQKTEKQSRDFPAAIKVIDKCNNEKDSDNILQTNHRQDIQSCMSKTAMKECTEMVDAIKDAAVPCVDVVSNIGGMAPQGAGSTSVLSAPEGAGSTSVLSAPEGAGSTSVLSAPEGAGSTSVLSAPPGQSSDWADDHLCMTSWGLPEPVLQQYHKRGITHMFPWQAECLLTGNVINGGNLVYSAPTSAGKTMVAELLVLKRVLEARKKAIIILPFVSVTREKMFYLQELYQDAGVRVSGFMGHHMPSGGFSSVDVAVCTIEKGNGLINRLLEENKLDQLGVIVVDELHLVGDPHRGYLLELLLTKIAYMSHKAQRSGVHNCGIQVVGMSATLPNLDLLARWLHADLYHTDYRPVPLTECVKIGTALYNSDMKLLRDIDTTYAIKDDEEHVVPLCIETIRDGHSILIFCPTKNWCEKLAQTVARSLYNLLKDPAVAVADTTGQVTTPGLLVLPLNKQLVKDVLEQLRRTPVGLDGVLGLTVPYGVAYHHAGLTFDERDVVEGAFRQGTLKVLIATSTLSSGVNLPARRVIIRTPVFHGHIIDFLTYKQMIGRAGRKGVDTAGESILLCKPNERAKAKLLVGGVLPPVQSTLIRHQGEELSTSLKRAILEVVVSGVAQCREDVAAYASCTLLAASVPPDAGNHRNNDGNHSNNDGNQMSDWRESLVQQCIEFLQDNEFVCPHTTGLADGIDPDHFTATQLGSAVLASSLSPDEGLVVFSELQRARQSFVLENELHIIYQVTPIYSQTIAEGIDWYQFFCIWERLPAGMRRVAELVGVQESFLARAVRGRILTKTENQCRQVAIHKRFYTALVLHDLVQEMPVGQVVGKYSCNKGQLQALQQSAATFAGMVTVFCARLGWSNLELILSQFQRRLTFGVQRELCDLVRISALNGQRARLMFNGGYQTVAALATAQPENIETLLKNSAPFQSKKKQESETEWDAERRNKARCIFLTGRHGVTEHEAADAIISEAKTIIQEDLGGLGIQWQAGSVKQGPLQADSVRQGPPQSGGMKQAPPQSGSSRQGPPQSGSDRQGPPRTSPRLISPLSGSTNKSNRGKLKRRSKSLTRKSFSPGGTVDRLPVPCVTRKSSSPGGTVDRLPVNCVISPPQLKQTSSIHKLCDQSGNSTNTDYQKAGNSTNTDYQKAGNSTNTDYQKAGNSTKIGHQKAGNSANTGHQKTGNSANIDHQKAGNSANIDHQKPGNSANIDQQKPGNSANTAHQKPGNSANIDHQKTGNSANIDHQKAGNSANIDQQKPGNSANTAHQKPGNSANTAHQKPGKSIGDLRTSTETMPETLTKGTTSEASNVNASDVQANHVSARDNTVNKAGDALDDPTKLCRNTHKGSEFNRPEIVSRHTSKEKELIELFKVQNSEKESVKLSLRESTSCSKTNKNASCDSDSKSAIIVENQKQEKGYETKHVKFSTDADIQINTPAIEKAKQLRKFKGLAISSFKKMKSVAEKSKIEIIEICDEENENNVGSEANSNIEIHQGVHAKTNTTTNVDAFSNAEHALVCKKKNTISETAEVCLENKYDDFADDFTDTFTLDTQTDIAVANPILPKEKLIDDKTSGHTLTSHPPVPQTIIHNSESLFSEDPNFDTSVLDCFNINQEINKHKANIRIEAINSSASVRSDQAVNQNNDQSEDGFDKARRNIVIGNQHSEAPVPALNEEEDLECSTDALDRNITAGSDEDMFNESNSLIAASDYERAVVSGETEMSKHDFNRSYDDLHIPYQSGQEVCFEQNDVRKVDKDVSKGGNMQPVTGIVQNNINKIDKVLGEFSSQKPTSVRQFERLEVDSIIALELAESFGSTFDSNEVNPQSNVGAGTAEDGTGKEDSLNDSLTFSMMEKVLEEISVPNKQKTKVNDKQSVDKVSNVCDKLTGISEGEMAKWTANVPGRRMEGVEHATNVENKSPSHKNCHKPEKNSKTDDLSNNQNEKHAIADNVYRHNSKPATKATETLNHDCVNNRRNMHIVEDSAVTRKRRATKTVSERKGESMRKTQRKRKPDAATDIAEGSSHNTSTGSDCVPPTPSPSPSNSRSTRGSVSVFSPRMQQNHSAKKSQTQKKREVKSKSRTHNVSRQNQDAENTLPCLNNKLNTHINNSDSRQDCVSVHKKVYLEVISGNDIVSSDGQIVPEISESKNSDVVEKDDDKLSPSFIDPNESGLPCTQSSFSVIDVCGDKRLFKTFIKEWRTKTRYSVSLACETVPQRTMEAVIGANFRKAAVSSSSVSCADTGLRVGQTDLVIVGIAVSWEDRDAYYVSFTKQPAQGDPSDSLCEPPLDQDISINIRVKAVKSVLQQAVCGNIPVTMAMFDVKTQYRASVMGCGFAPKGHFSDPKIACWMLDPSSKEKNLHRMVTNFLPTEVHLLQGLGGGIGVGSLGMSPQNPGTGRVRATMECVLVRHLDAYFQACLQKEEIYSGFTDVEMPAAVTLCRMELNGFGFSLEECESQKSVMLAKLSALEDQAYLLVGHPFSLSATDDVAQVLFIELQLPPNGDPSAAPSRAINTRGARKGRQKCTLSTAKDVLEKLKKFHPLPGLILEWRRITNALSKTLFPLQNDKVRCDHLSMYRIYSECQLHSATGRVSFTEPNLQNVPKEFEIMMPDMIGESPTSNQSAATSRHGKGAYSKYSSLIGQQGAAKVTADNPGLKFSVCMRQAFVPFEGGRLLAADYSQLELRMIAHLSRDDKLIRILNEDGDVFKLIAAQWKNKLTDEVTATERAQAKQVCYGMLYGIGPKALGEQLEVDENDAAAFMETFKAKYPGMRQYLRQTVEGCRTQGYVHTMLGRRRYLPSITSPNPHARAQAERQAVNTTIQGSAADLVKMAMIKIDQEISQTFPASQYTHRHPHTGKGERRTPDGGYLVLQLHDELIYEVHETRVHQVAAIVTRCMEHAMDLPVRMPVKVKVGRSWGNMQDII